jgi:hypothetical protein
MNSRTGLFAGSPTPPAPPRIHSGASPAGPAVSTATSAPANGNQLTHPYKENTMSLGTILLIVLVLILIGVFPAWPHSRSWGYGPSGGLGLVVVVILVLLLMGRL